MTGITRIMASCCARRHAELGDRSSWRQVEGTRPVLEPGRTHRHLLSEDLVVVAEDELLRSPPAGVGSRRPQSPARRCRRACRWHSACAHTAGDSRNVPRHCVVRRAGVRSGSYGRRAHRTCGPPAPGASGVTGHGSYVAETVSSLSPGTPAKMPSLDTRGTPRRSAVAAIHRSASCAP